MTLTARGIKSVSSTRSSRECTKGSGVWLRCKVMRLRSLGNGLGGSGVNLLAVLEIREQGQGQGQPRLSPSRLAKRKRTLLNLTRGGGALLRRPSTERTRTMRPWIAHETQWWILRYNFGLKKTHFGVNKGHTWISARILHDVLWAAAGQREG